MLFNGVAEIKGSPHMKTVSQFQVARGRVYRRDTENVILARPATAPCVACLVTDIYNHLLISNVLKLIPQILFRVRYKVSEKGPIPNSFKKPEQFRSDRSHVVARDRYQRHLPLQRSIRTF